MKERKISVLMVEPHKPPCMVELNNDLDSLQKAVSIGADEQGLIELVHLEDNAYILCNEEGKLIGLEPNRRFGDDILCGVFYVVADDEEGNLAIDFQYDEAAPFEKKRAKVRLGDEEFYIGNKGIRMR